jgi:prolyl-tRNA synthetase
MKVKPKNMLKTLVFRSDATEPTQESGVNPRWVVAVVRGDHEVNEAKLGKAAREHFHVGIRPLEDTPELRETFAVGFVGPDAAAKRVDAVLIVDPDAAQGGFWATGANEVDHHVKHFNWFRECGDRPADPKKTAVADVPSPKGDGGKLKASKGIEIGHVFKLGTKYSTALGANILDDKGETHPIIMGCYGIGVGRILIAAVESLHDDKGIIWPAAIAPYSVVVTPIKYDGEVKAAADRLYQQLNAAGIDTILDDRDARPGFKFTDADLVGFPVRLTVGDRGLKEGKVELKRRKATEAEMVSLDKVPDAVRAALKA